MSMFRNVMVYLGLGPDEEYEDRYFADEADVATDELGRSHQPSVAMADADLGGSVMATSAQPSAVGAVRPLRPVPVDNDESVINVRPVSDTADDPVVRAVPIQRSKPRALSPQSFGDAKILADDFKKSVPVIMNLQGLDRDLARRLIDFASGVCYSLGGSMEKMAPQVFLLVPKSVEVSDEDRRRIEERGFDR